MAKNQEYGEIMKKHRQTLIKLLSKLPEHAQNRFILKHGTPDSMPTHGKLIHVIHLVKSTINYYKRILDHEYGRDSRRIEHKLVKKYGRQTW